MPSKAELLKKKIEGLMAAVPPLPKNFEKWIIETAFKENKYIFYKKIGSKTHGVCSACGEKIELSKAKHNEGGKCPHCKAKITFKAINKAKHYADTEIISIIQKMKDGNYVIRYFKAHLEFKHWQDTSNFPDVILDTLINPRMTYWEGSREVLIMQRNGKTKWEQYEKFWDWDPKCCVGVWKKEVRRSGYMQKELLRDSMPCFYKKNLKSLLKSSKWKYSGLDYCKLKHMNIGDYLYTYETYPAIEMLAKLKYNELLKQIIYATSGMYGHIGGTLHMDEKRLGLSKTVFSTAKRLGLGISGIEFLVVLEETKRNLTDEQVVWVLENTHTDVFIQMLKWASPQKIINYVEKSTKNKTNKKANTLIAWRDYLDQCEQLKLNTKNELILFPKDLEAKHQEYTELIKSIKNKEIDQGMKVQYEKWNHLLSYRSGNLKLEVAATQRQLVEEGDALHHCVGGARYGRQMAEGKRLILFLRKGEEPYYTIEFDIESFKIIQNRGLRNCSPTKEVERFINQWKAKKIAPLMKASEREAM